MNTLQRISEGGCRVAVRGDPVDLRTLAGENAPRRRVRRVALTALAALALFTLAGTPRSTASGPAPGAAAPRDAAAVIECSTYIGGSDQEHILDTAVDADGYIYLTGWTLSDDFPSGSTLPTRPSGGTDAFVVKLTPRADSIVFAILLGGRSSDWGIGIDVDAAGNSYVVGTTRSVDFPVRNPISTHRNTFEWDAFVAKVSPDGSELLYSTCLGGSLDDYAYDVAVGSHGSAYVVGETHSADFPVTSGCLQPAPIENDCTQGCTNAFVAKIAPDGGSLGYSTFLGGTRADQARGVALDDQGHAFVTGNTFSHDFPILNAAQPTHGSTFFSVEDAFVTKLSRDGSHLEYSTFLGGGMGDAGFAIDVDGAGVAYVAGTTSSGSFPTVDALQPTYGGLGDAFVTVVAPSGSTFLASTYLGGRGPDSAFGVALHPLGMLVVTGETYSPDFPMAGPHDPYFEADAFVTKLAPGAASVVHSSYLGGRSYERATAVACPPFGGSWILVGVTYSTDFPCVAPLQAVNGGGEDGFVTVIADVGVPPEVSDVRATPAGEPFNLRITGAYFQPGLRAYIGDDAAAWERTVVKNAERVVLRGRALKERFPKGQAIQIRLVNPNGLETSYTFTR